MLTGCGIDAGNPQGTEFTFLVTAITIGILGGLGDCLLGHAKYILASTAVTLGLLDDFFVSGMGANATFYSWHDLTPLTVWQHAGNQFLIIVMNSNDRPQVTFAFCIFLGQDMTAM